ncbi:hypothetical protein DXB18_01345 [Clostridium sp. OM02-18AC]|uniref:fibronectin type III domain-containing protein n=1 Tax=Clostridium sp. OM02-18AC TaxID=2292311 RepID=UPI000E4A12C7|nr:fibronectin type III domain-containing protein [Clostridium sp. OM02-18AC]RHV69847.1 hypothetical protein DXB18_01345 [Clostridium sp. OM02-18AC]
MGKVLASGGGGGSTGSDDCTAGKAQVLAGYTAVTSDSEDEAVTGTMPNNGEQSATLKCGQSKQIPAGYTTGGTVTAVSLASQTVGDATAAYIYKGKTAWVNGSKLSGNMTCQSVLSFSVAAYSTSQVLATWKNPSMGPFSGVIICAKTGGYPTSIHDSRVYTGVGNNAAANGTSSVIISGLTPGTTYYFCIWAYTTCSAGDFYSGCLQATCAPTASGRKAFTASEIFNVPAGVRSINIFAVGGGSGCTYGSSTVGGGGGAGGCTAYTNNIPVNPGDQIAINVGAGGIGGTNANCGASNATKAGTILVSASGGGINEPSGSNRSYGRNGGSGGGHGNGSGYKTACNGGADGSNGGGAGQFNATSIFGRGQGTTTREFGNPNGTLYAGGGGGGGCPKQIYGQGYGGAGGGGNGYFGGSGPTAGSVGTGGGGCGAASINIAGASGGSGAVVITW